MLRPQGRRCEEFTLPRRSARREGDEFRSLSKVMRHIVENRDNGRYEVEELLRVALELGASPNWASGVYVFVQPRSRRGIAGYGGRNTQARGSRSLSNTAQYRGTVLGFWPQQAGMEMFIHNLAIEWTKAGDLVTLFAPEPGKPFEEIHRNFVIRRFRDDDLSMSFLDATMVHSHLTRYSSRELLRRPA